MSNQTPNDDAELLAKAKRLAADSRRIGGFAFSRYFAALAAAYCTPLLTLIGVFAALPPTAHLMGEPKAQPGALLSTVVFGLIAWAAIHKHRSYVWARRYLKARGIHY